MPDESYRHNNRSRFYSDMLTRVKGGDSYRNIEERKRKSRLRTHTRLTRRCVKTSVRTHKYIMTFSARPVSMLSAVPPSLNMCELVALHHRSSTNFPHTSRSCAQKQVPIQHRTVQHLYEFVYTCCANVVSSSARPAPQHRTAASDDNDDDDDDDDNMR